MSQHTTCNSMSPMRKRGLKMVRVETTSRLIYRVCLLVLLQGIIGVACYSSNWSSNNLKTSAAFSSGSRRWSSRSNLVMYLPPSPMSQTQEMVAKSILSDPRVQTSTFKQPNNRSTSLLSESVLASSDVLPSFRAAHGLLHPHTVLMLEEATVSDRSPAVSYFLETYRKFGPMACLPILSDSQVLPELTKALRGIDDL